MRIPSWENVEQAASEKRQHNGEFPGLLGGVGTCSGTIHLVDVQLGGHKKSIASGENWRKDEAAICVSNI